MRTSILPYTDKLPSQYTAPDPLRYFESIDDNYSRHIRHFVRWCRENDAEVTAETIADYFIALNESDLAARTINVKRAAVKARLAQWMEAAPLDDQVRMSQILKNLDRAGASRAPKVADTSIQREKYLSKAEINQLLDGARSRRQYLTIKALFVTGLRISELCGIKKGHAERIGDRIRIRILGKGNRERFVTIPAALWDDCRAEWRGELYLLETNGGKRYETSYLSNQIAKLARHVFGKSKRRLGAHTMRHSFAMAALDEGWRVDALSRYLGHSSVKITLDYYCHSTASDEDIERIIAGLV